MGPNIVSSKNSDIGKFVCAVGPTRYVIRSPEIERFLTVDAGEVVCDLNLQIVQQNTPA